MANGVVWKSWICPDCAKSRVVDKGERFCQAESRMGNWISVEPRQYRVVQDSFRIKRVETIVSCVWFEQIK